jgi:CRP/FNR family transcriptional regulator
MDLHHLDITAGLDESELTILHRHLHADCYPAGGKVFAHGEAGDRFYIVAIGQVEIRLPMADRQGTMRRIAAFPPGVIFGEMAMFNSSPRSADAIAVGETALWQLSSESLNQLKAEHPQVAGKLMYNIARQLSARLSVTNDELVYATRS